MQIFHWHSEKDILREILKVTEEIRDILKPRVHFKLEIFQFRPLPYYKYKGWNRMAAITAGATGVFQGVVTASDNSTVTTSGWAWTSSDATVTIANDASDATGATVDVTVPASDTSTTFTLTASASATSTTQSTATPVTASISVTITPASVPVTFSMNINQLS
jgi:hypothetical protein